MLGNVGLFGCRQVLDTRDVFGVKYRQNSADKEVAGIFWGIYERT
jgi:hypothetical protein